MIIEKVNVAQKLGMFSDHWNPRVVGELNGQQVKLAKIKGEFVWHKHDNEDEMFYVLSGAFDMELRDRTVRIESGEFIVIPKGVEHRPVALEEAEIMLFEPASTLNTGDAGGKLTRSDLEKI